MILDKTVNHPIIPIYTLKQITEEMKQTNPDLFIFDIDENNLDKIECNYPCRIICMGMMLITRGELVMNIDSQEILINEKDLVYLFPSNIVEFKHISLDFQMKIVLLSIDLLTKLNFHRNSQEAFDILSSNYSKTISFDTDIFSTVNYHIDRMKKLNESELIDNFYSEMINAHVSLIIYEIASFSQSQARNHNFVSSRKENLTVQFIGLVEKNFRIHKDVQFYADSLNISRKHLTKTIKDVLHKVPKKIIDDKVITEIKILLLNGEFNISQVMTELRFEDASIFSKFFKKNTGLTPSSYKKQKTK